MLKRLRECLSDRLYGIKRFDFIEQDEPEGEPYRRVVKLSRLTGRYLDSWREKLDPEERRILLCETPNRLVVRHGWRDPPYGSGKSGELDYSR